MTITLEKLRDRLRLDDFEYNNTQLEALMEEAKASLLAGTGIEESGVTEGTALDRLTDSFIVEYCRKGMFEGVDNIQALTSLAVQCEVLYHD